MEDINIVQILENAIEVSKNFDKNQHILSGISTNEVLKLADNSKVLKIYTQENDVLNLDLVQEVSGEWKQISSNNNENFATYASMVDEEIKILVDETKVKSSV